MTVRARSFLIVAATVAGLILVLYAALSNILLDGFAQVEKQDTEKNVERARDALSTSIGSLDSKTGDWANWDDAYQFVQDGNLDFINTNPTDTSFVQLRIDLIAFVNNSGQIVFAKHFDLDTNREEAFPPSLAQYLSPGSSLLQNSEHAAGLKGILLLPQAPLLVAARPILTSKGEGPSHGTLIFGRFLDAQEIQALADTTHLTLAIERLDNPQPPPDLQAARSAFSDQQPVFLQPLNAQTIAGSTLIQDIFGTPAILLKASMPRPVYEQGQATMRYILVALLLVGLVFGSASQLLVDRLARAWQARKRSEERFRSTLDQMLEGGQIIDFSWRYLYVNEAAAKHWRRRADELLRHTMMQMYPGIENTDMFQVLRRCMQDRTPQRLENEFTYVDGRVGWLDLSIQPVPEGLFILSIDITERKRAEEEIESMSRFPAENSSPVLRVDGEGHILYSNRAGEELVGPGEEQHLPGEWRPVLNEALASKAPVEIEQSQGDRVFALRFTPIGGRGYLNIYGLDITRRKQALTALEESEARFRQLADNIEEVFWLLDWRQRRLIYISPGFEKVWGRPRDPLSQGPQALLEAVYPADRGKLEALIAGKIQNVEYRIRHPDGSIHWLWDRATRLVDDKGQVSRVAGITTDITDRKRTEEELQRRADEFAALYETARAVASHQDLTRLLQTIIEQAGHLLAPTTVALGLYDGERGEVELAAASGAQLPLGTRMRLGEGGLGYVAETKEPVLVDNYEVWEHRSKLLSDVPIVAELGVPMLHGGELIGTLLVADVDPSRRFTQADEHLLSLFASSAASAVHNARLFEETVNRFEQLRALREIDKAISNSLDRELTLDVVLKQVVKQLRVDAADVLLLNSQTHTLTFAAGLGFRSKALQHTQLRLGEGLAGKAALERRGISIPDLEQGMDGLTRSPLLSVEGFQAYYAVPLIAKGEVKGVLEVFLRSAFTADSEWCGFLEALAGQAGIAIDNADLFEGLQRSNLELELAYDSTLEGWTRALDLREKETEGHSQRVAALTVQLAKAMGARDSQLVQVRRGALLHDIGKMGIPDAILLKPGPLTEEEWVIMRKHPGYAFNMLSPIAYLRPSIDIPYCHHEKWDGTGYPRGLKGEEIPFVTRIFAVADVWDALRSDRPYRRAWSDERVKEHIRGLSGTHFDPQVVEVFMQEYEELVPAGQR